jgi:hypothetical protein
MASRAPQKAPPHSALERFEAAVDAAFTAWPLPHPNGYVSRWFFLTVAEDSQRLLMVLPEKRLDDALVEHYLDRYKFSLRSCLARVREECRDWSAMPLPQQAASALYQRAQQLLFAGIDYSVASQICASAHEGSSSIHESGGEFEVKIDDDRLDKRYGSLEAMRQSAGEHVVPHSVLFWFWVTEEESRPAIIWKIKNSTALRRRRVVYEYDHAFAYDLARSMSQTPFLIPEGWEFAWGTKHETTLMLNSLSVRVLYHLLAVQFGAQRYQLKGGAEHELCLVQSRDKWIEDIEVFSQLELQKIERFVDALTYGRGSKSPDQALQPLVPLGSNLLGLGPLGWLSSNAERNLLSLQARLDPKAMDRQSYLFERRMTAELIEVLRLRWSHVTGNITLTLDACKEEIDLLVCEPDSKTVAVLELRWMLSPADPREVQVRKTACWQKVEQVKRKAAAVALDLQAAMLASFGLSIVAEGWAVHAMVVVEGFGGAKSLDEAIPVVPEWVLKAGIELAPSLQRLVEWTKGLGWLPVEGREFETLESRPRTDLVPYRYPSITPLRTGRDYIKDATEMLAREPGLRAQG